MDTVTKLVVDASPNSQQNNDINKSAILKKSEHTKTRSKNEKKTQRNTIVINNSQKVHVGPAQTIIINPKEEKFRRKSQAMSNDVLRLTQLDTSITDDIILFVSRNIGENWKFVFRILGYTDNEIYQFKENNKNCPIDEVIYSILLDWKQNKPKHAKLGTLTAALWDAGDAEIVNKMVEKYLN